MITVITRVTTTTVITMVVTGATMITT